MIVAVMKTSLQKLQSKHVKCQNCRAFSNESYRQDLISNFTNENSNLEALDQFYGICIDVLNQHAPCKTKMLRGNHL